MQKKQAKVFAGLLSMSLAVSLMTPLQGVSGQAARRKIALSKKSVTMTVGQKKTIRIKNAKGKRIKWSIKKKSIASYKKSGKYAVKLTAKKKGTTTLTCKVKNGYSDGRPRDGDLHKNRLHHHPDQHRDEKDLHREQLQRAGLSAALGVQIQAVRHVQEGKEQEHAVGGAPLIQVVLVAEHQRIEDIDDQQDTGGNAAYPVPDRPCFLSRSR